jgi:methionyl-tRNA synthetase
MTSKFYLTTTLPYVNAKPHIGFALEIIQTDVLARHHANLGEEVFFNTGTDEHGKKIYEKALESKQDPQEYVDEYAEKFDDLKKALNLSYNNFIRTTDKNHVLAAQEIWKRCNENGYIEKKIYKTKYCVGCELEKTDSDLIEGKCEFHPTREIELIDEENYFFLFSKLERQLLELYADNPEFVVPANRQKEIENFVKSGLSDFSISRLKEKMPWGIEVPNDPDHVMYVWFDALTNYISALGWPDDMNKFESYWGTNEIPNAVQIAGKDNLRQQSAMWQAMLLAAELPVSRQIMIHGFITSDGQKMSKSIGNVIDPMEYVEKYGTDALRYYLLAKINPFDDSDFTKDKFETVYKADLQNGLGNLVARVAGLSQDGKWQMANGKQEISEDVKEKIEEYRFDLALAKIWERVRGADKIISENKIWTLENTAKQPFLDDLVSVIRQIGVDLAPFMPVTASKITKCYQGEKILKENLFPRLGI